MRICFLPLVVALIVGTCLALSGAVTAGAEASRLVFCCAADNDVYRVLADCGAKYPRHDDPLAAVREAAEGAGVLLLADQYPHTPQSMDPTVFELAAKKHLWLYVELPASLPGLELGKPRGIRWERGVITSDTLGPELKPMRIVSIHDCHFVPESSESRPPRRLASKEREHDHDHTAAGPSAKYELPLGWHGSCCVKVPTVLLSRFC